MARKILLDTQYTFSPSTKTLTVPNRYIPQERLLLITNVTQNQVIYNFSDPSLKATSYVTSMNGATGTTTIVLNYNTTTMSSTDKIQVVVDEYSEAFRPEDSFTDPVGKFRTSTPQALIDTDFEYGTQVSKWENLTMINNRPFGYQVVPNISNLASIAMPTGSRSVTVNTSTPHYLTAGMPIVVQDTYLSVANGNYVVDTVPSANQFTYTGRSANTSTITSILDANKTAIYQGATYTNAAIGSSPTISMSGQAITVTTSINHGLSIGNEVAITGTTAANTSSAVVTAVSSTGTLATYTTSAAHGFSVGQFVTVTGASVAGYNVTSVPITAITSTSPYTFTVANTTTGAATFSSGAAYANYAPNGAFIVSTVNSLTQFTCYSQVPASGTLTTTGAAIYVRAQGQFLHRPFDGGVIFSSNGTSNFEQSIRQTRRYFRYQSGKGIQVSTGTILKPNLQLDALTSSGTTVTVQTREQHNLQPGTVVTILGANETAYNGTFTVTNVLGYNQFQYTALSTPSTSPASGSYYVAVTGWYGAVNRMGLFEQQNGMFWEYDGQTLSAVRRNSTFQLSGKVSVTNGSNTVTQTNSFFPTNFSRQLIPGDQIALRGQTYRVTDITSDTSLQITPAYRGTTDNYVIVSKTQELRVPQSSFNIDKLDGTGPSGYKIDLSKMQMWFVDFAWYGAGVVRFGVRGTDGNIIYCHRMPNNNVNSEAFLRSGNLPGRYESATIPPATYITSTVAATDSTINVVDTSKFPSAGTIVIRNTTSGYEYVNYTGTTATSFTGATRGQAGNASIALTIASGSNLATVVSSSGLQVGQRVVPTSSYNGAFPDNTFISAISGTTLTLSQAAAQSNPTVIIPPMGLSTGTQFTYSATAPIAVELAFPTYAPSISHWGTSVIMDGGFDDDKSLLFTYGQSTPITIPANATRALMSIRVAPSVDNGIGAGFGQRELMNRMQLVLRTLDVNTSGPLLVRAYLNGQTFAGSQSLLGTTVGTTISLSTASGSGSAVTFTTTSTHGLNVGDSITVSGVTPSGYNGTYLIATVPTSTTFTVASTFTTGYTSGGTVFGAKQWTNAVGNVYGTLTSSLAQIADYAPNSTNGGSSGAYTTAGGEVTGGFFTSGVTSLDVSKVRDLGNSILGGGGVGSPAYSNTNIYPDGPDVLTLVATNLSSSASVTVQGRIAWTEAQA